MAWSRIQVLSVEMVTLLPNLHHGVFRKHSHIVQMELFNAQQRHCCDDGD